MPAEKRARTAKNGPAGAGGGAAGGSSGSKFTMKAKPANGAQDKGKGKERQQQQDGDDDDDEEEALEDLDDSEADDMSGLEAAGDEDDSEGEDSDEDDIIAANEDAQSRQKKSARHIPLSANPSLLLPCADFDLPRCVLISSWSPRAQASTPTTGLWRPPLVAHLRASTHKAPAAAASSPGGRGSREARAQAAPGEQARARGARAHFRRHCRLGSTAFGALFAMEQGRGRERR